MNKKTQKQAMDQLIELFIAPNGKDRWSGNLAEPNADKTDGPLATIGRAQAVVRKLKVKGELPAPVRVVLRGGVYPMSKPLVFTPKDSGSPATMGDWGVATGPVRDITYTAYPGETPILSGGQRITGWQETKVHGHAAWVAHLPQVKEGKWQFNQLWVNGHRASRTRLPKAGLFQIQKLLDPVYWKGTAHQTLFTGQANFRFNRGDLKKWRNLSDVEFVALYYWIEDRIPFAEVNTRSRNAKVSL